MLESINIGSAPNDGTGDPLRRSFQKVNAVIELLNGGKSVFIVIDDNYISSKGQVIFVDTTAKDVRVTAPQNPTLGATVEIAPLNDAHSISLYAGSNLVDVIDTPSTFTYVSEEFGWVKR